MNCPHCHVPLSVDARFCPACGKATAPTESGSAWIQASAAPDLVGREIAGRYRIVKKLGEGGMGAVYRGEQISLKRSVAVKILKPELGSNQLLLQRFDAEAQAVAKLSHPNTVNIYDFGRDTDGTLFIAMEYIEGRSLREAIQKEGPFSIQRALAIAMQVAAALSDAHARSIVHRDLKPDNVMLQERGRQKDVVRVLDFGIAKLRDDSRATQQAMTQAGDMLGTPQYMAPEQIKGETTIDGRTDVYALGCMIYEMVTGRLPFEASTVMAILTKHLVEDVTPPTTRRPELGLPPAIDHVVLAAMAKEPKDRPPTMDAYAEMLGALLAQLPPDPNAANRSAGLSVQQVAMGAAVTPQPFGYQQPTPPPAGFGNAPTAASFGPPPGLVAPGYVPPPIAPTAQIQGFAPPSHVQAAPAQKSKAPLYAILGVLLLGGAGVAVWAARKGDDGPTKPSPGSAGSAEVAVPDPEPDDDKPDPQPGSAAHDDPWAAKADDDVVEEADDTPSKPASVGTAMTPIPKGAYITPPAGFTKIQDGAQAVGYTNAATGESIILASLDPGTNDPKTLANRYATQTGASLVSSDNVFSAGAQRPGFVFALQTPNGPVAQVAALYITSSYRLGVLYIVPGSAAGDDEAALEQKLLGFFRNNVHMP